uniref:Uncharacterized protein n=1 Tax=Xiphophorus maculatus TaxID=8083 RepID=A0A3B5QJA7_XIPMA
MQLVAGKVQEQDQQSKTLHIQTAVETVSSPCRVKLHGGKNPIGFLFFCSPGENPESLFSSSQVCTLWSTSPPPGVRQENVFYSETLKRCSRILVRTPPSPEGVGET